MTRSGAVLVAILVIVVGCAGREDARPSVPPSAIPVLPSPSAALLGSPPAARLTVEGGDPVEGQLGTYTWANGGSDSPWLPGAPIAAATGEPLTVAFDPPVGVAAWRALIVPAGADGPAGGRVIGEGSGTPRVEAPEPGSWTLEIQVTFAASMGAASYAWALTVS